MATKKNDRGFSIKDSQQKLIDKYEKMPLVATRCWVDEIQDSYTNSDDAYVLGDTRRVSKYFDSRSIDNPKVAAEGWVNRHDPDKFVPGGGSRNYFKIRTQYLRVHTEEKWGYL